MHPDRIIVMGFLVGLILLASAEAFFLKWGSDSTQTSQKTWMQPLSQNLPPGYRYQYSYSPYETRKVYQQPQYGQQEVMQQNLAPIPISIPAGTSLTPVSLQHVQLVPCMCPVAPEEADKLHEQVGPGPYLAQTFPYSNPQVTVSTDAKSNNKQ